MREDARKYSKRASVRLRLAASNGLSDHKLLTASVSLVCVCACVCVCVCVYVCVNVVALRGLLGNQNQLQY
ncbi:hypothetical protein BCV70DRAFT_114422 [Testicularia cyperi]|uniref:Uncharacterized protein n=1 Tax=Testicularia cyperi TaxID=1882483 RepID=A0A317XQ14_9BASI|nr:hypothetical protein BCV70DRAFT_114422 [Testicularia cyperi]